MKPLASVNIASRTLAEGDGESFDLYNYRKLLPSGDGKKVTLPTYSGATLKKGL